MSIINRFLHYLLVKRRLIDFPNISPSASFNRRAVKVLNHNNLYMGENTNLSDGAIIMNTKAKFVLKKGSGAAYNLLVSTGNHLSVPGFFFKQITDSVKEQLGYTELNRDVVVEEDVWLATNVTLLSGVNIGRGAEVGSGSVVRKSIPPYACVIGNPARIVGFKFTPEEIVEHEKKLYPEGERIPLEILQKNYEKYFLNRIKEIKQFTKL